MSNKTPLSYANDNLLSNAQSIALNYNFVIDNTSLPRLNLTDDSLELLIEGFLPLKVDFTSYDSKRRQTAGKQQGLVKACKPMPGVRILDVTAGWGRDSAILASFGADVLMLERQNVMSALLDDAIKRLYQDPLNNLSLRLLHVDAIDYLTNLLPADYPDVIYIDPMHPERQKSALVKKDMQALQQLFGPDLDAKDLIKVAISRAKKRVVVKWPQRLPAVLKPNNTIAGKTIRFDLYNPCSAFLS